MTLEAAKAWLGPAYVLHPAYDRAKHPHHSAYALVDVRATVERVKKQSFSSAVEEQKRKLRLVYGKVAA